MTDSPGSEKKTVFVVLLKETRDAKCQYQVVKRLHENWPERSFSDLNEKLRRGDHIVLKKTDSLSEAEVLQREFEALGAIVDIVEQKTIGGAPVF